MWDFLDVARNLFLTDRLQGDKNAFTKVFRTIGHLQRVHSKRNWTSTTSNPFSLRRAWKGHPDCPGLEPDEIPEVIATLKMLIVRTLEERITFPREAKLNFEVNVPQKYWSFIAYSIT